MPYCQNNIIVNHEVDALLVLSVFAQQAFKASSINELTPCEYNIDGGLNDLRAYLDPDRKLIRFICRYDRDIKSMDRKISAFAQSHPELGNIA
jgi:hypothetical protein